MKNLRIIVDSDGVLAETTDEVLKRYNKEYDLNFKEEDILFWDLSKTQKEGTNMGKYFAQKGFFSSLKPVEESIDYMHLLSMNNEVIVATISTGKYGKKDKREWFNKYYPFIKGENIHIIEEGDKSHLTCDIMLDDAIHILEQVNCKYPVLFDRPWNRSTDKYIRVYDWTDFYGLVQLIRMGYTLERIKEERKTIEKWRVTNEKAI